MFFPLSFSLSLTSLGPSKGEGGGGRGGWFPVLRLRFHLPPPLFLASHFSPPSFPHHQKNYGKKKEEDAAVTLVAWIWEEEEEEEEEEANYWAIFHLYLEEEVSTKGRKKEERFAPESNRDFPHFVPPPPRTRATISYLFNPS